ncbi:PH domain-containing protein [Knoellia sp. 3-2P3]|uniref:PH domain-containing protein n=1 Tax=unclassified Knoellia TaxID=2618719 RepID=UPI0023DAE23D|nr:PH domain-containing protein [Knoellia sp. 3-2P3]MDF2094198.1 PH domain-containing protein [Knoellia sp. 3-2P3]
MTRPDPAPPTDGWRRLHPLSPLLRGGLALVAAGAWLVSNQLDSWMSASELQEGPPLTLLGVLAAAGLLVLVLTSWLSWRVSRFRIGASTLEVRTGLVLRQHRQVRYDRIQAVDLRRPLLARLAGLSEVRVQSAGAGSDARLAYLPDADAHEVRRRLMALAGRGDERAPEETASLPDDRSADRGSLTLVRVPGRRLLQATLFRGRTLAVLVGVPTLLWALATGRGGVVAVVGPALLAFGGNTVQELVREWEFRLQRDHDGIHVSHGLTELKASSVPVHRVQAVALRQPVLWRAPGWWRIEVNVAGVGEGSDDGATVLLPVGTVQEALTTLRVLRPDHDVRAALAGMTGAGVAAPEGEGGLPPGSTAYTVAPPRAVWLSPLVRRRHGYAVTPDALLVCGGRVRRFVEVVPHARVQSLRLRQGPLQRRLGLATVEVLTTPGPARPRARHLDAGEATRLLNAQVGRSSRARERVQ